MDSRCACVYLLEVPSGSLVHLVLATMSSPFYGKNIKGTAGLLMPTCSSGTSQPGSNMKLLHMMSAALLRDFLHHIEPLAAGGLKPLL